VPPPYRIEPLGAQHERKGFTSGVPALDRYFHEQVTQDIRRLATSCYVARDTATGLVAGYYTIAAGSVPLADLPEAVRKKLPRYPSVPVARLGRLGVDQAHRGRHLGSTLLWDAVARAARSELAVFAVAVDAKDEQAQSFYRHHGFVSFGSAPLQLFLSLVGILPPAQPLGDA
jgi:ribosomal protein S18 acetylase RimI-like enzyme